MRYFFRVLAAFVMTIACISAAHALPPASARDAMGLQDVIKATLVHNPQLAAYGFRVKALAGERQTANLRPELRVVTEFENVAGSGAFNGINAAEFTLSLASVIELGDQRLTRLTLASARQRQLESSQHVLVLDVLTQATQQFIAVVAAQEQLTVQQDARQLAKTNQQLLDQFVRAGRMPEAELFRAEAALARADIAVARAQQQLDGERIQLSRFWAETAPNFNAVRADLFVFPAVAPLSELIAKLQQNPDLASLANAAQVRAAEWRQARAQGSTTVEWTAGVRHLNETNDAALVMGVSVPLGSKQRASGAITVASANYADAEFQRHSAETQLAAQLTRLYGAYQQSLAEVSTLQTRVLPLLKRAMSATHDAFNSGRYSYLELNLAQRELLDAQSALIAAAARAQILGADIERLTGATSLSSPNLSSPNLSSPNLPSPDNEFQDLP